MTGTSGKTSVSVFTRQIFEAAGHPAASLGTIGLVDRGRSYPGGLTTPDPVKLHETLDRLAREGLPLPAGWLKVADHPRRGLVVTVPVAEVSAAVDWLLQAARLLTRGPPPPQWSARRYAP